ncbi:hypothetical protein L6164_016926 [Bauhinia variegata]|uniref:Uncharacterized protein n=1 Tax=Bauhinia variegata TaxID=167791 RepID=A0ACB9N7G1_BAUVA|nr:hypothetical protein L6164_016926 [Bauhinia variegata]
MANKLTLLCSSTSPKLNTSCRKIEIKKISKENNLQVTFSKRRIGIFKKASELCTLCAAKVAIIIFSPGNKVFSFGPPSVNDLVNFLLTGAQAQTTEEEALRNNFTESLCDVNLRNVNAELTQFCDVLDMLKKHNTELNKPELEFLMSTMEELNRNITLQAHKLRMLGSNSSQFLLVVRLAWLLSKQHCNHCFNHQLCRPIRCLIGT